MAIVKKTGLFYELLIRGNWDPKKGELGTITTYQLQTGSAVVDDETNELVAAYAPDPAIDLTKDQAITFLDGKFADFIGQLDAMKEKAKADAETAAAAHAQALQDLQAKLDAAVAGHRDQLDQISQIIQKRT